MRIDINQIPPEGLIIEEEISPQQADLETEIVKFRGPVAVRAAISKIINAVTVDLNLTALMLTICSRCLNEFPIDLRKSLQLDYAVDYTEPIIDLSPDIRDQIILDYPIKPLCSHDCRGICPKCGRNLNQGNCDCKNTQIY